MIPDKIFINPIPKPSDGYVGIAWTEAHGDEYKVYIRKDALLQLLNECKDNPVITELQKGNIQELIDKIESL